MKNLVFILIATLLFVSCKKNEVEESTSRFMVVHASPNTNGLELFIDYKPILLQPVLYTSNTFYRDILSGVRNFQVKEDDKVLIDTMLDFTQDAVQSIFIYDKKGQVKINVLNDDLQSATTGNCRVRFLQLVPNADSLDLVNTLTNTVIFNNTNIGGSKNWTSVPAGIYNFELQSTANQSGIYTDWRPDTLLAGKNYTIMARGLQNTVTSDTLGVWILSNNDF